jgi:hypothetical protein
MTAVEWLLDQMKKHYDEFGGLKYSEYWNEEFQHAFELEKQQIIDAFKHAQVLHALGNDTRAEQYYNETYKTKTE